MNNHEKFVNLNISSQNLPNYSQNENQVINVSDEIERGAKLYEERQLAKRNVQFEPLYKTVKTKRSGKTVSPFTVYKYYCSRNNDNYYRKPCDKQCKHYGNVIINRDIMTPSEHLNFLAKPKFVTNRRYDYYNYCQQQQQHCYYVKRYPLAASSRIEQLSVPPEKHVINTWLQYGNIFTTRQINNLANLLIASKHTSIAKAFDNIIEDKKLKKMNKMRCLKQVKKIKRKINVLKAGHIRQVMCSVAEALREYLMDEHNDAAAESELDIHTESLVILKYLANMLCINVPSFESDNLLDRFLINLSRNIAILINNFLRNAGLNSYFNYQCTAYTDCDETEETKNRTDYSSIDRMQKNLCDEVIIEEDEENYEEDEEREKEIYKNPGIKIENKPVKDESETEGKLSGRSKTDGLSNNLQEDE